MNVTTIQIKGREYPAVAASDLQNGMTYWDGSEIINVKVVGKTTTFDLVFDRGQVARKVRSASLIALSADQVAVSI